MANKYFTGEKDRYGNGYYDIIRICADMKSVVQGKKKMSKDLYEFWSMRFTIAHYNMQSWFNIYNGRWRLLGDEIRNGFRHCGDIRYTEDQNRALDQLVLFLYAHDEDRV